jgi:predicted transcriptional regulator
MTRYLLTDGFEREDVMSANAILTVQSRPELKGRLDRLAGATNRTASVVAEDAIADYVAREAEIVGGIERGLADLKSGRLIPHNEAMERLEATIAAAEPKGQ